MSEPLMRVVAAQIMAYPFKVWGFGEGIALEALWQAAHALGEESYRAFVIDRFEAWLAREPRIVEADHSAPGMLLLEIYQATGHARYLQLALDLHQHMAALPADPETGARYHRPQHPDFSSYLYVDCMEVDAPFLAMLSRITGDHVYYDEAVTQLEGYAALLQDASSGLFYHRFDYQTRRTNGAFWGRGNGWALLGLVKTLRLLPAHHPGFENLRRRLERLAAGLAATQNPDGSWSTVLDQPDTYAESSLPAMFAVGIRAACQAGFIPSTLTKTADRAHAALLRILREDGTLPALSIATPPGDAAHYTTIQTAPAFPWGQGPALLALLDFEVE